MRIVALVLVAGCFDPDAAPVPDAAVDAYVIPDALLSGVCPGGHRDELQFAREDSCGNDGSVEFCIPDNDAPLIDTLAAISPTISCAAGGGRARCHEPPGRLLCFYPTEYPGQCLERYGAMTDEVWADMCEIAALPQVNEIVHTIIF